MTQKRFKKMLMSKGYSRNAVNKIAKETAQSGKTYAETYKKISGMLNVNFSFANDALKTALEKLRKVALTCATVIAELNMKAHVVLGDLARENTENLTRKDD